MGETIVLAGTGGIRRAIATARLAEGRRVVVAGRDAGRAGAVAAELGEDAQGLAVDLTRPASLAEELVEIDEVDALVLTRLAGTAAPSRPTT